MMRVMKISHATISHSPLLCKYINEDRETSLNTERNEVPNFIKFNNYFNSVLTENVFNLCLHFFAPIFVFLILFFF